MNLDDRFDAVRKGKKDYQNEVQDRVTRIYERRSTKDGLKDKVLKQRDITHEMLKEIHNLRSSNQAVNLEK